MKILISYDIDTTGSCGRKRLSRIASKCLNYGVRVQNSLYECELNAAQLRTLQKELEALMDDSSDRILLYNLGNAWEGRCIWLGKKDDYSQSSFIL